VTRLVSSICVALSPFLIVQSRMALIMMRSISLWTLCLFLFDVVSPFTEVHWRNKFYPVQSLVCLSQRENYEHSDETIDDELLPAPVSLRRQSILFGEDPETKKNNSILNLWIVMQDRLPYLITGGKSTENPLDRIYNVAFVRIPTTVAGLIYGKNLFEGHPLVVDLGDGPFEVHPIFVAGTLFFILR